jgi:hypothetical protein
MVIALLVAVIGTVVRWNDAPEYDRWEHWRSCAEFREEDRQWWAYVAQHPGDTRYTSDHFFTNEYRTFLEKELKLYEADPWEKWGPTCKWEIFRDALLPRVGPFWLPLALLLVLRLWIRWLAKPAPSAPGAPTGGAA